MNIISQALRITDKSEPSKDYYLRFRKSFTLDNLPAKSICQISAESEYVLYVNGKRVPITQYSDYPNHKTYTTVDLASYLLKGKNIIAILVYRVGFGTFTHIPNTPGLLFALQLPNELICSDSSWRTLASKSFTQNKAQFVTSQLGFTYEYNATKEDNWLELDYDDSAWEVPVCNGTLLNDSHWQEVVERPVPVCEELNFSEVKIVQQGSYKNNPNGLPFVSFQHPWDAFTEDFANDDVAFATFPIKLTSQGRPVTFNSAIPGSDGVFCTIDLGKETVGFLHLELTAPAGTVISIHHGEHLDDGVVRSLIESRTFIDTYVAKEGDNVFDYYFRRYGARYLQLYIATNNAEKVSLTYAALREVVFPLPLAAKLSNLTENEAKMREISLWTMRCCMHDHYEDCPWREQGLYAYDSRNQMLYGYYVWGNYDFAQSSLDLLGRGMLDNGYLSLTAPGVCSVTIPSFSFVWVQEILDFVTYSGRKEFFATQEKVVKEILTKALERQSKEYPGLYISGANTDKRVWDFYEWVGDLGSSKGEINSLHNIYLAMAMKAASALYGICDNQNEAAFWQQKSEELCNNIVKYFKRSTKGLYSHYLEHEEKPYEHVQILMIMLGLVPEDELPNTLAAIMENKLIPVTLSVLPFVSQTLFMQSKETRAYLEKRLYDTFISFVNANYTTFPETAHSGSAFRNAGSMCHGWSAIPAWFGPAVRLGVRPLDLGFKKFAVKPWSGNYDELCGEIPTPYGMIEVAWKKVAGGLAVKVKAPKGLEAIKEEWPECPIVSFETESF